MLYYKRIALVLVTCSITFSGSLFASNDSLTNNTDGDIDIRVDYLSKTIPCKSNHFTVKKGEKINISFTNSYCNVEAIYVASTSGSLKGKSHYANVMNSLERTEIVVTVHGSSNNTLVVDISGQ